MKKISGNFSLNGIFYRCLRLNFVLGLVWFSFFSSSYAQEGNNCPLAPESCYYVRGDNYESWNWNKPDYTKNKQDHCLGKNGLDTKQRIQVDEKVSNKLNLIPDAKSSLSVEKIQNKIRPWVIKTENKKYWGSKNLSFQDFDKNYHPDLKNTRSTKINFNNNFWTNQNFGLDCQGEKNFLSDGKYGYCTQYALQLYLDQDCFKDCTDLGDDWEESGGQNKVCTKTHSKEVCPLARIEGQRDDSSISGDSQNIVYTSENDNPNDPGEIYLDPKSCEEIKERLLNLNITRKERESLAQEFSEINDKTCICNEIAKKIIKYSKRKTASFFLSDFLLAQSVFPEVLAQNQNDPLSSRCSEKDQKTIQDFLQNSCSCPPASFEGKQEKAILSEQGSGQNKTCFCGEPYFRIPRGNKEIGYSCLCPEGKEYFDGKCEERCPQNYRRDEWTGECVESVYGWTPDHLRPKYLTGANWNERILKGDNSDLTYWMQKFGGKITTGVASLAVLFIAYNGFMIVTASGNEEQIKNARTGILWTVLGLFVITFAYVLVKTVISLAY